MGATAADGREATADDAVLWTEDLRKSFGSLTAIDGISWRLPAGKTKAIIGPNGAGKTTFFNLLSGVLEPSAGQVFLAGRDVTGLSPHEIVNAGLVKTFQQMNVFDDLTVFENVRIAAQAGVSTYDLLSDYRDLEGVSDRALSVLERIGLAGQRDAVAGELPYGDQRKVEIGIALATDPDVLLLDEPTAGMSREETDAITDLFGELAADPALTIVITEHDMDVVMNLADTVSVFNNGLVLYEGTPEEVTRNENVRRVYLGE